MKTKLIRSIQLLMVPLFLMLLSACASPVKTAGNAVAKGAKVSAKATVEGAKATGRTAKGAAGVVVGK